MFLGGGLRGEGGFLNVKSHMALRIFMNKKELVVSSWAALTAVSKRSTGYSAAQCLFLVLQFPALMGQDSQISLLKPESRIIL